MTGTDKVLLARDDGSGGDVEAGTVRDNEEDEVRYGDRSTVFYRNTVILGCLLLVPVPRDVRPGHAVRDDDADQLVLAHHQRGPLQLQQQLRRHVGQDYIQVPHVVSALQAGCWKWGPEVGKAALRAASCKEAK